MVDVGRHAHTHASRRQEVDACKVKIDKQVEYCRNGFMESRQTNYNYVKAQVTTRQHESA